MEGKMKVLMIFILSVLILQLPAIIINIPADQPTIQGGINVSADGDTVLVQPNTYVENINYIGKNITVASLFLTTQDSSYIEQTVIDGNQNGSVVIFENGEDSTAIITGFSLINGSGTYCDPISIGNYYWGGGIFCIDSSPTINNLKIFENSSDIGGGISLINSNPILDKLEVSYNFTIWGGAGIFCGTESNPEMNNLKIINNTATDGPAGLHFYNESNPTVSNSIISGNTNLGSYSCGGGVSCVSSSPTFISVEITDNCASSGGGIDLGNSNSILENVQITNNLSYNIGPGLRIANANLIIINSTISDNTSDGISSNIFCMDNVNLTLINTISWSNLYWEIWFHWGYAPNTVNIVNSNIKNGINGINLNNNGTINWLDGNIVSNPLFINPDEFDYHLQDTSHCIGAGIDAVEIDGTWYYAPEYDIEGNPRPNPFDSMPDMGAYENPLGEPQVSSGNFKLPKQKINLDNHPNPFNPSTTIEFSIQNDSNVELSIFNIKGQIIKTLAKTEFIKGSHSVIWNGTDDNNKPVSSGVYFYKLNVSGKTEAVKKCLLLK